MSNATLPVGQEYPADTTDCITNMDAAVLNKILHLPTPVENDQATDDSWESLLEYDDRGKMTGTINNALLILTHDNRVSTLLGYNTFNNRIEVTGQRPWQSAAAFDKAWTKFDISGLRHFMEQKHGYCSKGNLTDAIELAVQNRRFHPIADYLSGLVWDGVPRIETLLVDYLGAKDDGFIRTVTRKTLAAAVARIFEPGCKFDYVLVLIGNQGDGKSTFIRTLGAPWYADSIKDFEGRDAMEMLQGKWILEVGELSAMKKSSVEAVKRFLSSQEDTYRSFYGRTTTDHPRQCILIGTTNAPRFLTDTTGNRRFWPVIVGTNEPRFDLFTYLDSSIRDQIWAEAVTIYRDGEALYLDEAMEAEAKSRQNRASVCADLTMIVKEFLDLPIPERWSNMSYQEQLDYYRNISSWPQEPMKQRTIVCTQEIKAECFGILNAGIQPPSDKEIRDILMKISGWVRESQPKGHVPGIGSRQRFVRLSGQMRESA